MGYAQLLSSHQPIHSSVLDFVDYIGLVSNCKTIYSCVLTPVDCIRVPSFRKFISVWIGFSCMYFYAFHLGSQFIFVDKIVF